jgi:hypothetical protein
MCTLLFVLNSLSRVLARLLSRAGALNSSTVDMRSLGPVHACFCGSRLFKVGCMFEDNDIAMWFVDAECADCGALVKVPTPADVK